MAWVETQPFQEAGQPRGGRAVAPIIEKELRMTKALNLIQDIVRDTKHPFRQSDNRPAKSHKNRYERRKVRAVLRLGDWTTPLEA